MIKMPSNRLLRGVVITLVLSQSMAVPASTPLFNLVDTHGQSVSSNSYAGKVQVVFFGFAECKDVCPMSLTAIKQAYDALSPSIQKEVQPLFITVDPERDTVAKVDHFVKHLGNFVGLTGSAENVQAAIRAFRVFAVQQIGKSKDNYDINHTSLIYLIDKNGTACDTINSDVATKDLVQKITDIAGPDHICKGFI